MKKLSLLAYFTFAFIASIYTIFSATLIDIAKSFGVDTYVIGYFLTFMTIGTSTTIFLSGYLYGKIKLKLLMIMSYVFVLSGIAGITLFKILFIFAISIFLLGIALGIMISTSNYIIIKNFQNEERRYKINILNFFYGFGSIICPLVINFLYYINMSWKWAFIIFSVLIPLFLFMIIKEKFEFDKKEVDYSLNKIKFNSNILLVAFALFFYVISEVIFTTWFVTYLRDNCKINPVIAGYALTLFWIFMSAGRLFSGLVSKIIKVHKYIIISSLGALFSVGAMLILGNNSDYLIFGILISASIAGFFYAGLYPSILSYGTIQVSQVPPKLMTFFITMGSAGTLVSFPISSFIKQKFNLVYVIGSCMVFMLITILLIIMVKNERK